MKGTIFFLMFSFAFGTGMSQGRNAGGLGHADSVLLNMMAEERDPAKARSLAIDLILLSDDKVPLSLMEEAKWLYQIATDKKDATLEAFALSMYGQAYRVTGNFTKALQYHFKAIELSKTLNDNSLVGYVLNQSGHIYKDREEVDKAVPVYKESIEYSRKGDVPVFQFYPYMNLGFVYMNAKQPDSGLYYSGTAEKLLSDILAKETPEMRAIMERSLYVYTLSNLAGAYSQKGNKTEADDYFKKADRIVDEYRGYKTRYFQFYYFSLAKHYQRYGLVDSSLWAARQAINSVIGTPVGYLASGPAKMLSDHYESVNADSTVKYLKLYLEGDEVMNSTRVTQQLQMITVEEEQKRAEVLRAEKMFRQRMLNYALIGGLLLVSLVAIYMIRANRIRQRINREVSQQKAQLERTLTELRSTQAQLVQSEKMASLGELTAGIAHEIQNPLNFVNNFSDINKELVEEARESLDKGDLEDVRVALGDIGQNQEKISHHGRRADAIVKSMLQHSRTSTGQKEPTDLADLADEYLKLSYHGMRAKDKDFNCILETDFDPGLPKVNVVPQDIGRVLLNLYNNAFQAVMERKKSGEEGYEPKVRVEVWGAGGPTPTVDPRSVTLRVTDNGPGVPEAIRDKIFQPFFTTKPTGQGTGLGLSLSYDIVVKGHGGELKVEAKVGADTEFILTMPLNP